MLKINEIFGPTVQGEGKNMGRPVAFLRLAECNLSCTFCDTKFTWSFYGESNDEELYHREEEVHEVQINAIYKRLKETGMNHLIISGGEPLLQHKQLTPLLVLLKEDGWFLEVETNGTLYPKNPLFWKLIDQVNCSPKLSNAGDPEKKRIKKGALKFLSKEEKVNFKFVISNPEDMKEVSQLIKEFALKEVRLMPECRSPEELEMREAWLKDLAEKEGLLYTSRLSILKGNKRGE